jgi:dienelactone hydrolase
MAINNSLGKYFILFLFLVSYTPVPCCFSQTISLIAKKNLDSTVFDNWAYVSEPGITNDGRYAGYVTQRKVRAPKELTIKSLFSDWEMNLNNIRKYAFSLDGKKLLVQTDSGTLKIMSLPNKKISLAEAVNDFKLFNVGNEEWLLLDKVNKIDLINISTNRRIFLNNIESYQFGPANKFVILSVSKEKRKLLVLLNLQNCKLDTIGNYSCVRDIVINSRSNKLAFITEDKVANIIESVVLYYNFETNKIESLANNTSKGIDHNMQIAGISRFSKDDERVFIFLKEKKSIDEASEIKLKVWSYQDLYFKANNFSKRNTTSFLSFIDLKTHDITQIQKENEVAELMDSDSQNYIKIVHSLGIQEEEYWNKKVYKSIFLFNCESRTRIPVNFDLVSISSDSRYIVGIDTSTENYVVYDIQKKHVVGQLTEVLEKFGTQHKIARNDKKNWRHMGWLDSRHVLFNDGNDIWNINVDSPNDKFNLTNGLGKREGISFQLLNPIYQLSKQTGAKWIVCAFNQRNKKNGFYELFFKKVNDPVKLSMTDHFMYFPDIVTAGEEPIKARNLNTWIVSRERADSAKNYYITHDFASYQALTNNYPERDYNWLTTELINFNSLNGVPNQAILYKPANFDPHKNYPVVLNYYENMTQRLNHYIRPEIMRDNINIAWFVSNGYLVCTPDITYSKGNPGESALNAVVGVAKYLFGFPYIDSMKVGLNGHSFGAFETNYIISHSNIFKAAISTSGVSDLISASNSIAVGLGFNFQNFSAEVGQTRIGYSLWQRTDLYIKNSALLNAAEIKTPLLLMANENDGVVNVDQGLEMFFALRRLGKPSWLLQYEGEAHSILKMENRLDYTKKVLAFYDYYLKDRPVPDWMK